MLPLYQPSGVSCRTLLIVILLYISWAWLARVCMCHSTVSLAVHTSNSCCCVPINPSVKFSLSCYYFLKPQDDIEVVILTHCRLHFARCHTTQLFITASCLWLCSITSVASQPSASKLGMLLLNQRSKQKTTFRPCSAHSPTFSDHPHHPELNIEAQTVCLVCWLIGPFFIRPHGARCQNTQNIC